MKQSEQQWDKLLNIKTTGRDDSKANQFNYPYEPTPYVVLERLANSGLISKKDTILDYGCGKGRVDFFLSYQLRCKTIGIEYDERMLQCAMENKNRAISGARTDFVLENATIYEIPEEINAFYFFNPFSVEILQKVIGKILESYYTNPRYIKLFFYYPSDEYLGYLMTLDEIMFSDEIQCDDLFEGNNEREKILIFEIG